MKHNTGVMMASKGHIQNDPVKVTDNLNEIRKVGTGEYVLDDLVCSFYIALYGINYRLLNVT